MSRSLFSRGSTSENSRVLELLRLETAGGLILLVAATAALLLANSPLSGAYERLSDATVLGLSMRDWAADGLLAVFFLLVGVELKHEFLVGDLRDPRRAVLPVLAAVGGMVVPAAIYAVVVATSGAGGLRGWAIPTATDIAFAVAVLAVIGTHLPAALRTFLLTLAVVDDLLGVTVIAVFYSDHLRLAWFAAAIPLLALAVVLMRRGWYWPMIAIAPAVWLLVHHSGIHPTIAGVLLGFAVPVRSAAAVEHRLRPLSSGLCVPLFAFFAAGVSLAGFGSALRDPIALAVVAALVIGKPAGVLGTTWLLATFTRAELDQAVDWPDILGVSLLTGIGFTVSLLIASLAFAPEELATVKLAIIAGSLASAMLAAVVLRVRNVRYRWLSRLEELESGADES